MLHTYMQTFRDHSQTIWLNFKNSSCTLTTMYGTLLCILHFIEMQMINKVPIKYAKVQLNLCQQHLLVPDIDDTRILER